MLIYFGEEILFHGIEAITFTSKTLLLEDHFGISAANIGDINR